MIVCGAGLAGVSAARAATEAGAQCVLLEKTGKVQGRSGQFCLVGGQLIRRWGIDNLDQAADMVNQLMLHSGYRPKQRILDYAVRHSGADFDWYLEGLPQDHVFIAQQTTDLPPKGTKIHILPMQHPQQPRYHMEEERYPVYHCTVQVRPSHVGLLANNLELARQTGRLTVLFETPAKRLLRDGETGRVTGVIAQTYDGEAICVKARRGVVLATGDYSGDPEMLAQFCPWLLENHRIPLGFDRERRPINSGDGHKMGLWIGAKMEDGPHAGNAHSMGSAIGVTPYLMLDLDGKRFVNEDCPGGFVEAQISNLRGRTAWQFFDAGWPQQIPYMPVGHGACSQVLDEDAVGRGECLGDLAPMDGYTSQRFIDRVEERGGLVKANTLEELVEKTGLPKAPALASIQRYNQMARQGRDEDFGKKASRMFPLEQKPFYAARMDSAPMLCCHGGLESDEQARVLDENREVIPGLYAAGNVQGNRFGCDYPTTLPGLSHAMCLTFGRLAGTNCAKENG